MNIKQSSLIFIALFSIAAAADTVIEVIPLLNRSASELQPLLAPVLEYNEWLGADGANLLVRTTPERLVKIKTLVEKLDTLQQNLSITVLQSHHLTANRLNADTRVRLGTGINISNRYYQTQTDSTNESMQTIRTLSGNTAYIKTGNLYPRQNLQIYSGAYAYPGISTSTQYTPATTGFAVTPRLSGQEVILDIAPWSDNLNARGQIQTQSAQATLKIKLGEWVELGAVSENSQSGTRSAHRWQTDDNSLHILVKVDKVN